MEKRKGPSTSSRPRARRRVAKEGSEAKEAGRGVEDECDQLRCEVRALGGERAKLSEKERELEEEKRRLEEQERELQVQRRKLEEHIPSLRLELEQVQRKMLPKSSRLEDMCSVIEVENSKRLDKLPQEVMEKILDELDENDLFPLALSCRYFRQKQKELVARTRQSEPESGKPRRALKTTFPRWPGKIQPVSADYLRFCTKENVSRGDGWRRDDYIRRLAAFHGHVPLLQDLLKRVKRVDRHLTEAAGESSSSQSPLLCFSF